VGRCEGKKITWKTRCRWEDNIKTDLQEVESEVMNWIDWL
jgi:hypothetical protein